MKKQNHDKYGNIYKQITWHESTIYFEALNIIHFDILKYSVRLKES